MLNKYNVDYYNLLDQLTLPEESDWDWYGIDLLKAIKTYRNIPDVYINMAKTIYLQLITEQIEEIKLN